MGIGLSIFKKTVLSVEERQAKIADLREGRTMYFGESAKQRVTDDIKRYMDLSQEICEYVEVNHLTGEAPVRYYDRYKKDTGRSFDWDFCNCESEYESLAQKYYDEKEEELGGFAYGSMEVLLSAAYMLRSWFGEHYHLSVEPSQARDFQMDLANARVHLRRTMMRTQDPVFKPGSTQGGVGCIQIIEQEYDLDRLLGMIDTFEDALDALVNLTATYGDMFSLSAG